MSALHSLAPRPPASLETVHNILGSLVARYRKEEVLTVIRQIPARQAKFHPVLTWRDSARYALVAMFVFTSTAHFNKMKHDLARMIPAYFPRPLLLVYFTGVLELLGAAGLVLPQFRRLAGICLIELLVGMFIANVNAAHRGVILRGNRPPRFGCGLRCRFSSLPFSGGQLASKRYYGWSGRLEELLNLHPISVDNVIRADIALHG